VTKFTVVWAREAQDQLAALWLDSSDRETITQASDEIDRALADEPSRQGFDVREGLRGLVAPPLFAIFVVKDADRVAEVLRVRLA
jgi:hypothetical protein